MRAWYVHTVSPLIPSVYWRGSALMTRCPIRTRGRVAGSGEAQETTTLVAGFSPQVRWICSGVPSPPAARALRVRAAALVVFAVASGGSSPRVNTVGRHNGKVKQASKRQVATRNVVARHSDELCYPRDGLRALCPKSASRPR